MTVNSTCAKIVLALMLCAATALQAKEIVWGGQVRPRLEYRDPSADEISTSMRVRAQMKAMLDNDIDVFVQVQDVRLWGEEGNTLGDFRADNFDLHQGYIDIKKIRGAHSLRLGRQAIALGGQRLVGAVEWTQQGRAFDGLQFSLMQSWGKVDVLAIQLAEAISAAHADNAYLLGGYATWSDFSAGSLDLYALYNKAVATGQWTAGLRLAGEKSVYAYRVETSLQTGERAGNDVAAYMVGARIGRPFGALKLALWFDYLSGDDDPADGEVKVFDTLFATNHKFYGFADLFLNIPVHTAGLGLRDIALKASLPLGQRASLAVHAHSFSAAEKGGLKSAHLAEELDITLTYRYRPGFSIVSGVSRVLADDALAVVRGIGDDTTFAYAMASAAF